MHASAKNNHPKHCSQVTLPSGAASLHFTRIRTDNSELAHATKLLQVFERQTNACHCFVVKKQNTLNCENSNHIIKVTANKAVS
jgi:hypothetical protein